MTVPSFSDIGKNAWDIFKSGYHYGHGLFKISITNKSEKNLELNSNYNLNCDTLKADGSAEAKVDLERLGVLKQKWMSDGTISLEYGTKEKIVKGLSTSALFSYNPETSVSGFKWATKFHNDNLNLDCSASHALNTKFRFAAAAVFGIKDLHLGYRTGYDMDTNAMTMNDLGLAYAYENVGIHLRATSIPYEWGTSVFYKVNEKWETAINGIYASRNNREHWTLGIGTKIKIDENSVVRMKLNKDRQVGLSLQQKIHDFIKLTFSLNLDFNDLPSGDHKVGLAIDIED